MDGQSVPTIRIRKGSECPSVDLPQDVCPAPLAFHEGLSDLESEAGSTLQSPENEDKSMFNNADDNFINDSTIDDIFMKALDFEEIDRYADTVTPIATTPVDPTQVDHILPMEFTQNQGEITPTEQPCVSELLGYQGDTCTIMNEDNILETTDQVSENCVTDLNANLECDPQKDESETILYNGDVLKSELESENIDRNDISELESKIADHYENSQLESKNDDQHEKFELESENVDIYEKSEKESENVDHYEKSELESENVDHYEKSEVESENNDHFEKLESETIDHYETSGLESEKVIHYEESALESEKNDHDPTLSETTANVVDSPTDPDSLQTNTENESLQVPNQGGPPKRPPSPTQTTDKPNRPPSPSFTDVQSPSEHRRGRSPVRPPSPSVNTTKTPSRPPSPAVNRSRSPARPPSPSVHRSKSPVRPPSPAIHRSRSPVRPPAPKKSHNTDMDTLDANNELSDDKDIIQLCNLDEDVDENVIQLCNLDEDVDENVIQLCNLEEDVEVVDSEPIINELCSDLLCLTTSADGNEQENLEIDHSSNTVDDIFNNWLGSNEEEIENKDDTSWETFEFSSVNKAPSRPPPPRPSQPTQNRPSRPPPPSRPARPALPPGGLKSHLEDTNKDEESRSSDTDDTDHLKVKKKKKRGISPGRIKGYVDKKVEKMKEKKAKKHRQKEDDDLEKYLASDDKMSPTDKKSSNFLEFEKMQARITDSVQLTKESVSKIEESLEETVEEIESSNSPWTIMGSPDEANKKATDTKKQVSSPDWIGFEDSFSEAHIVKTKHFDHVNITPSPSPKHQPLPPYNSRRNSSDGKNSTLETFDLLGLTLSEDVPTITEPTINADLLALESEDAEDSTSKAPEKTFYDPLLDDMLSLSRNPITDSGKSSGISTPIPIDSEAVNENADDNTHVEDDFINEFLGIKPVKVAPTESTADLDPFGFGVGTIDKIDANLVKSSENLMAGFIDHDITQIDPDDDPFSVSVAVKDFVAGGTLTDMKLDQEDIHSNTQSDNNLLISEVESDNNPLKSPQKEKKHKHRNIFDEIKIGEKVETKGGFDLLGGISFMKPPSKKDILAESELDEFDPRSDGDLCVIAKPLSESDEIFKESTNANEVNGDDLFASFSDFPANVTEEVKIDEKIDVVESKTEDITTSTGNPFSSNVESTPKPHDDFDIFNSGSQADNKSVFNPFATVCEDTAHESNDLLNFDPFQTIHGDDAFVDVDNNENKEICLTKKQEDNDDFTLIALEPPVKQSQDKIIDIDDTAEDIDSENASRFNPFNKEHSVEEAKEKSDAVPDEVKSPLSDKSRKSFNRDSASECSYEEVEEDLSPLSDYLPTFEAEGWQLMLRYPIKKKLSNMGNRGWKQVFVRLKYNKENIPVIRIYNNENEIESFHELQLQASYNICNLGLQQFDTFGKCHTVKIQYVFYRERMGVKAERLAPTIGDLARVRDIKGLKDIVHKPKTTMILEHAPQNSELLKFGGHDFKQFRSFILKVEDALFRIKAIREKSLTYTKDEITMDIVDEYHADIDKNGSILAHKARVRVFCLAFLTGNPKCDLGLNDRKRRGKEIVGRHDIIPIKTEEWVRTEDVEFHSSVEKDAYERHTPVKFAPLDAIYYEIMRFRVRPQPNKELPLQISANYTIVDKHIEYKCEVLIPGYSSSSRRAAQTPCEDIEIRFPVPAPWIYLFRVEKRFKYGSIHSSKRKSGKIKGLERITMIAQGLLPPSLIEVSKGLAKYENVYQSVVWRIPKLPDSNEGAYKTHYFKLTLDLGSHDVVPEELSKHIEVEYHMKNSTVSRAQIRSISIESDADEPPDRWVHHLAKYEYKVELKYIDPTEEQNEMTDYDATSPVAPKALAEEDDDLKPEAEKDSDFSSDEED